MGINSEVEFMEKYNPSMQFLFCNGNNYHRCFGIDIPSIRRISDSFGMGVINAWLKIQISNLNEYCGSDKKMDMFQIEELANVIQANYYYLKPTEIMAFLFSFKSGAYGEFYGSIDAIKISCALKNFAETERRKEINKIEREIGERKKRIEQEIYEADKRKDAIELLKAFLNGKLSAKTMLTGSRIEIISERRKNSIVQ